ncbi:CAP domain-containing protein, partial [Streptomyces collinus]
GPAAAREAADPVVDLSAPRAEEPTRSPSASATPSASASAHKKKSASPKAPAPVKKRASAPAHPVRPTPGTAATPDATPTSSDAVDQVVALVNQQRATAGCGPVTEDPQLEKAAQGHSDDMAARNFFEHTNPDGADPGQRITAAGYRWSTYGENIAKGQQTPQSVMDSWMNSPGHRANILNCSFKNIGVGVHRGSGGPWWTQDFGAKL